MRVAGVWTADASVIVARWGDQEVRAALFDFNGTLSDDEHLLQEVFAEIFVKRFGWSMTEAHYQRHLRGLSDREIVERVAHDHSDEQSDIEAMLAERRDLYIVRARAQPPIGPGARDLVRALRSQGALTGIVTGARRYEVDCVLDLCGLGETFDVVVTEEDASRGKPDPEGYLLATRHLNVPPEACLVFEDSRVGVRAARRAGMTVLAVGEDSNAAEDTGRSGRAEAHGRVAVLAPSLLG